MQAFPENIGSCEFSGIIEASIAKYTFKANDAPGAIKFWRLHSVLCLPA